MPRPLRPIADGLAYHVINRGNNRQPVFNGEGDFVAFLQAIADLKQRKAFSLYGYCLLRNHIHLLIRKAGRLDQPDRLNGLSRSWELEAPRVAPIAPLSRRRSRKSHFENGWESAAIPPFLKTPLMPVGTPIAELSLPPAARGKRKTVLTHFVRILSGP
jgi:hypothetical protein